MRALLALFAGLLLLSATTPEARAGGSPETTLVVVNRGSPTSWKVANAYVRMRRIPATHVCSISGVPHQLVIDADMFRERIWKPIRAFLAAYGLEEEIDTIAYSAGFPFGVNYAKDFGGAGNLPQFAKPTVASLTGMTYLHRFVMAKSKDYLDLAGNQYLRLDQDGGLMPGHGFRHAYNWTRDMEPDTSGEEPDSPDHYYLSTMLGFTGIQGNTVPEILAYLERGAAADGTFPKGRVYLMDHKDVRSRTRRGQFDHCINAMKKAGGHCAVLEQGEDGQDGRVPVGKDDVMGLVAGIASFDWTKSKSTLLPGAIAEHLTSFGARFDGSGQTKISAFLRAGAVGSSGAVAEPYALWQKFPLSSLHVHYREGCSLAESFYQSVSGPYQLLVIGDPLARPYAHFAKVELGGPAVKGAWKGTLPVTPKVKPAKDHPIRCVEIWLDGQHVAEIEPGATYDLDTTQHPDGEHELRLVAVEDSPVETRSFSVHPLPIKNGGTTVTIKGPRKGGAWGETLKLSGKAKGAKKVVLLSGHRVLAHAKRVSSTWRVALDTRQVGEGITPVQARATFKDGRVVLSPVYELEVRAPGGGATKKKPKRKPRRKPKKGKAAKGSGGKKPGLRATVTDAKGKEHTFAVTIVGAQRGKQFIKELRAKVKGQLKAIRLEGEFEVKEAGVYELGLNGDGALTVKVKGETVFERKELSFGLQRYAAVALEAGWHALDVEYAPSGTGDLSIWLGGDVVNGPLQGKLIRH